MTQKIKLLTPENFWQLYSEKLNKNGTYTDYKDNKKWTKVVLPIAKDVISNVLNVPNFEVDLEGFRIDIIGYTTKWPEEMKKEKKEERQHDWELKIAYEHENDPAEWDYELCNLCHIVADLRVISSYYDFRKEKKIEELLQDMINKLGMWRIHRVPNSHWLFVFGPLWVCKEKPFRAFTIDSELQVVEITGDKKVIPGMWKK
ncbi:MAG: hypothetical protein FVQ85_04945 [Planctomycetes bacterium]|nr:hypothetical protein [Planctomycetota bacterium]